MPTDDGFRAHDDDRVEHRAEDASGEGEQQAISRMNSGLWHGTTQDDDLLAKDCVFDKEGGAGSEGRTQRAHDGFEDFDEHRGERASTGGSADKSWRKLRPVQLDTEYLRRTGIQTLLAAEKGQDGRIRRLRPRRDELALGVRPRRATRAGGTALSGPDAGRPGAERLQPRPQPRPRAVDPGEEWMKQVVRNLTDPLDDFCEEQST
jgi:hypothetical protein